MMPAIKPAPTEGVIVKSTARQLILFAAHCFTFILLSPMALLARPYLMHGLLSPFLAEFEQKSDDCLIAYHRSYEQLGSRAPLYVHWEMLLLGYVAYTIASLWFESRVSERVGISFDHTKWASLTEEIELPAERLQFIKQINDYPELILPNMKCAGSGDLLTDPITIYTNQTAYTYQQAYLMERWRKDDYSDPATGVDLRELSADCIYRNHAFRELIVAVLALSLKAKHPAIHTSLNITHWSLKTAPKAPSHFSRLYTALWLAQPINIMVLGVQLFCIGHQLANLDQANTQPSCFDYSVEALEVTENKFKSNAYVLRAFGALLLGMAVFCRYLQHESHENPSVLQESQHAAQQVKFFKKYANAVLISPKNKEHTDATSALLPAEAENFMLQPIQCAMVLQYSLHGSLYFKLYELNEMLKTFERQETRAKESNQVVEYRDPGTNQSLTSGSACAVAIYRERACQSLIDTLANAAKTASPTPAQ
jgi:hypothetical protein